MGIMPQHATSTSFKPGHPPTKGAGRPKQTPLEKAIIKDLRIYARQYTEKAMATLIKGLDDIAAPLSSRIAAANSILDRGWGKPKEIVDKTLNLNVTQTKKLDISHLSDEELDVLESVLRKTNMLMIEGNQGDSES